MIRLSEKLKVSEEEKSFITNNLFTFLKSMSDKEDVSQSSTARIVTLWIRHVKKPKWLENKIDGDIQFLGEICEFIDTYKREIYDLDIDMCKLNYM